jgi:putative membrane protein
MRKNALDKLPSVYLPFILCFDGILFLPVFLNKLLIMKKVTMYFALIALLVSASGCGGNNESSEGTTNDTSMSSSATSSDTTTTASTPAGTAGTGDQDTSKAADRDFVLEAASGGLMEVALGKLAQTNASSSQVKEFGRMMVTDHTKANTELKSVAAKKNITVSATPLEKQQKHIDELKEKKGAEFDKAYVDLMVDDHKEDISKFQDEANKGNDSDIKAFAAKTLPVLTKHLDHVQKIQEAVKK